MIKWINQYIQQKRQQQLMRCILSNNEEGVREWLSKKRPVNFGCQQTSWSQPINDYPPLFAALSMHHVNIVKMIWAAHPAPTQEKLSHGNVGLGDKSLMDNTIVQPNPYQDPLHFFVHHAVNHADNISNCIEIYHFLRQYFSATPYRDYFKQDHYISSHPRDQQWSLNKRDLLQMFEGIEQAKDIQEQLGSHHPSKPVRRM